MMPIDYQVALDAINGFGAVGRNLTGADGQPYVGRPKRDRKAIAAKRKAAKSTRRKR